MEMMILSLFAIVLEEEDDGDEWRRRLIVTMNQRILSNCDISYIIFDYRYSLGCLFGICIKSEKFENLV